MAGWMYKLGRTLRPTVNRGKWLWHSMTGDEGDILRAEEEVGRDLAEMYCRQLGVGAGGGGEGEPAERAREVREIGRRLSRCVRDRRRSFSFYIAPTGEANAFALPGGHIFVTAPLLRLIGDERDQLAFVLGHEMAHVIRQHPMERLVSDTAVGAAMKRLRVAGMAGQWLKSAGFRLMQSAYSRDRELTADRIGAALAEAAGFDAEAAIDMMRRLGERGGAEEGGPAEYFASHPPLGERIAELRRFLRQRR